MRIACILTVFPSVSETFIFGDLRALKEAGHEVVLLHFIDGDQRVWQEDAQALRDDVLRGGPLISLGVLASFLSGLLRQPLTILGTMLWILARRDLTWRGWLKSLAVFPKCVQFAADCRRWNADLVHAAWANHAAVAALVIERLTGIPFTMSAHAGQDVFRDPVMLRQKMTRARFVTVCNRHAMERLLEVSGPSESAKLHYLSHGVALDRFPAASSPPSTDLSAAPRVLWVGRLIDGKGLPYLLESAQLLQSRGKEFHLDMLGDGPDRAQTLDEIAARGLQDRVTLHGAVEQHRVVEFLSRASVLVLPSVVRSDGGREGLPNTVLESMSSGVPVVATRIASVEEAIEDGVSGLLVPQRDSAALSEAVARLLDDPPLRHRLAANAREFVERRYDRRELNRRFVALFEAL